MEKKILYKRLITIRDSIDQKVYPEIHMIICESIYLQGQITKPQFEIACELHGADEQELLPSDVAEVIIDIYLEEIEKNNSDAMLNLGALYYTGRAGKQDYQLACKYYTMADERGNRQATENLGYIYYYGRTGEVDYKKAYHYFVKGALEGKLNSLYKIGDMYKNGYYVEKDETQAFIIYNRCHDQMDEFFDDHIAADIYLRMGNVYYYGIGTNIDYDEALRFYQLAEQRYYEKISNGDYFSVSILKNVIEKQNEIRKILLSELPNFEWRS